MDPGPQAARPVRDAAERSPERAPLDRRSTGIGPAQGTVPKSRQGRKIVAHRFNGGFAKVPESSPGRDDRVGLRVDADRWAVSARRSEVACVLGRLVHANETASRRAALSSLTGLDSFEGSRPTVETVGYELSSLTGLTQARTGEPCGPKGANLCRFHPSIRGSRGGQPLGEPGPERGGSRPTVETVGYDLSSLAGLGKWARKRPPVSGPGRKRRLAGRTAGTATRRFRRRETHRRLRGAGAGRCRR